ncbi:MAG: hypothetical protein K0R41_1180 [Geminicoccaceae bacterium]|nr:hypothetical protein [Geminicoccaceae bacterium]
MEDQLYLLAARVLESLDDLPDCLILLGVVSLVPPDHEVGTLASSGAVSSVAARMTCTNRLMANYSLRICLIRRIASSTACSGVIPSVTTRWIAVAQTNSWLTSWCRHLPEAAA